MWTKTVKAMLLAAFLMICSGPLSAQTVNEQLHQAVRRADTAEMRSLLDAKADPGYVISLGAMKMNMLTTAVNARNTDVVRMLLRYKADVHWRDGFNTTPLLYAAGLGSREMVDLLLNAGADINDSDGKGITVLSAAKESRDVELIRYIEERLKKGR